MSRNKRKRHGKNRNRKNKNKNKNRHGKNFDRHGEDGMLDYLNKMGGGALARIGKGMTTVFTPREECWESGIEVISSCGNSPNSVPVTMSPVVMAKINALMQEYPRIEWLAYFTGNPENPHHMEDIIIPKQEVTTVRVDVDEHGVSVPTLGVIHSHHGMGNGFSGTDHDYINQNHNVSLCISHGGIQGQVRLETACGKYVIVKATVQQAVEGYDHANFLDNAKALIKEKTYTYTPHEYAGQGYYRGNRSFDNHDRLGLGDFDEVEDNPEFPVGASQIPNTEEDVMTLGIMDMADAFKKDVEEYPLTFDVMDLCGYKEILGEVINPARNYERFAAMYSNFLDNNSLEEDSEDNETFLNLPMELLDELDTSFQSISQMEKGYVIELFKALKEAIDYITTTMNEEVDESVDAEETPPTQTSLPTDEELWTVGEDDVCNCIGECVCINRTPEVGWNAGDPETDLDETAEEYKDRVVGKTGMDIEQEQDTPSDNLWSTGNRTGNVGNA